MKNQNGLRLTPYQTEFVNNFVARSDARTLLVAPPGTGKTTTASITAKRMLLDDLVDRVLVLVGHRALADQWHYIIATDSQLSKDDTNRKILVATYAEITQDQEKFWKNAPIGERYLFVFDEIEWLAERLEAIATDGLVRFPGSRVLFIARDVPSNTMDVRFEFNLEYFSKDTLTEHKTQSRLIQFAPSVEVLQRIKLKLIELDDLTWREFEQLLSQMLEADGYNVELMRGTKDGGVDVVAIRDLGDAGLFKSVWQAKKHRRDRNVGLSIVRELADTRLEHGASKAIIVTTSYLTRGALSRVERDRYLLGKVDRQDLDAWIERTLRSF